jgi:DNA ligase D-like protein (predicted 3'-phosphoesterase)
MKLYLFICACIATVLVSPFLIAGESSMVWKKIKREETQLKKYRERRNFTVTSEPSNGDLKIDGPLFVVQKHDARHLHYDFRLEIDGVLKSWAIPKGPSNDPRIKRLAVPTDDHPLGYADFEGVIPEGEYGAGTVMVWDLGTYKNVKRKDSKIVPMKECYKNGQIEVFLDGEKLYGSYALIRTIRSKDETPYWLFIKMRDEYTDSRHKPLAREQESVLTGRTLKQIAADAKGIGAPKRVKKAKKTKSVTKIKRVKKTRVKKVRKG